VPLGKGRVCKEGSDVTIVAVSYLVREAMEAADVLSSEGISAEVIDPRTLKPLDIDLIVNSVKKTGRLVVADPDWIRSVNRGPSISNDHKFCVH